MNREQKIILAKQKLNNIEAKLKTFEKEYLIAKSELVLSENSFDIDEEVRVTLFCQRGCCIENQFEGKITGTCDNGSYNVKSTTGIVWTYIWSGDMARI